MQPDTEIGVAKWCANKCLDNPSQWCVQNCMQQMYNRPQQQCAWTNGGECAHRQRSGTYYGCKAPWPRSRTACAYPIYRQDNTSTGMGSNPTVEIHTAWASRENARRKFGTHPLMPSRNCPPDCGVREVGERFWDVECDNEPPPSTVDYCRGMSQGDEEVYERCLEAAHTVPRDDYYDASRRDMWSPIYR